MPFQGSTPEVQAEWRSLLQEAQEAGYPWLLLHAYGRGVSIEHARRLLAFVKSQDEGEDDA